MLKSSVAKIIELVTAILVGLSSYQECEIAIIYDESSQKEAEVAESCYEALELVGNELKKSFVENDWSIEIDSDNKSEDYGIEYDTLGFTSVKDKKIFISAKAGSDRSETLLHELGHYIDSTYTGYGDVKYWSQTTKFVCYMRMEEKLVEYSTRIKRKGLGISYSPQEFFAETVSMYFRDKESLMKEAPLTGSLVSSIIEKL